MTREEAIKMLECELSVSLLVFGEKNDKETQDALKMAIEALKEQRPHGAWVESKERKGHFYCSECVQQDAAGKWREIFDYKYNFCPNCGADMRKEGESEK